jgi:hypothetical protein
MAEAMSENVDSRLQTTDKTDVISVFRNGSLGRQTVQIVNVLALSNALNVKDLTAYLQLWSQKDGVGSGQAGPFAQD